MPADGVVILAASSLDDWDFIGGGGSAGSYLLTVSPETYAASVSGRVVDGKTGAPLPQGPPNYYWDWVELRRCGAGPEGRCGERVAEQDVGADGLFAFSPVPVGRYQVVAAVIAEGWIL